MTYAYFLRSALTWMGVLLALTSATAQTSTRAPASSTPLFGRIGVINSVDVAAGAIVINDVRYRLAETVRVYTYDPTLRDQEAQRAEARLKRPSALHEGLRVGYNVTGEGGGQRGTLAEAWLLPAGKIPALQSGEYDTEQGQGNQPGTAEERRRQQTGPRTRTTR